MAVIITSSYIGRSVPSESPYSLITFPAGQAEIMMWVIRALAAGYESHGGQLWACLLGRASQPHLQRLKPDVKTLGLRESPAQVIWHLLFCVWTPREFPSLLLATDRMVDEAFVRFYPLENIIIILQSTVCLTRCMAYNTSRCAWLS